MIKYIIKLFLKTYKFVISPVLGSNCRHYPSCSQYALEALDCFPLLKALKLICIRLLRCNPWSAGGYDPLIKEE